MKNMKPGFKLSLLYFLKILLLEFLFVFLTVEYAAFSSKNAASVNILLVRTLSSFTLLVVCHSPFYFFQTNRFALTV